jgi:hypothetical protein
MDIFLFGLCKIEEEKRPYLIEAFIPVGVPSKYELIPKTD